ncbi:MAG: hypothetical protein ACI8S3_002006, partial [Alphaproteobacteria bacterium]
WTTYLTHICALHLCFQDKVLRRPVEITEV